MSIDAQNFPVNIPVEHLSPLHQALESTIEDLELEFRPESHQFDARNSPTLQSFAEAASLEVQPIPRRAVRSALAQGDIVVGMSGPNIMKLRGSGRKLDRLIAEPEGLHRDRQSIRTSLRDLESYSWIALRRSSTMAPVTSGGAKLSPWERLWGLVHIERNDVRAIVLYAIGLGILSLATPIAIQALVNTVAFGGVLLPLIVLIVALFIGLSLAATLRVVQFYVAEILQRRFLVRVAEDLGRKLPMASKNAQDERDLQELTNRFFDVITVQKATIELLLTGSSLALQTGIGILLLAFYHPWLMVFSVVLIIAICLVAYMGRGGTKTAQAESKAKFAVAAWLEELARTPDLFYAGAGREFCSERLDERVKAYIDSRRTHFKHVLAVLLGGVGVQVFAIVLLLAFGGYLVMERELTLGQLVAAEIIVAAIAVGVGKFGRLADKTFDSLAALDKLGYLFDLPSRTHGFVPLRKTGPMSIETQDLVLKRGGSPNIASEDIRIDAGQRVWIDSRSGAGVTTWLESVAGHRSPWSGEIRWDGRRHADPDDLAYQVLLLNRNCLFAGTVRDNLRVVKPHADDAQLWDALETVGLVNRVEQLGGLGTTLHSAGAPLSEVERSQLIMARALLLKPRLLLIDHVLDIEKGPVRDKLWRIFLGDKAPWTALVASERPEIQGACPTRYTLRKVEDFQ